MAWASSLQTASYRGVAFEVQGVTRSGQRALAAHEYPYTAGADLEDLGLRARRVRVKAIVYGSDYEIRLADLINALELPGPGELVHPIHGSMTVLPESWDDDHEAELVDGAQLNIQFVETRTRQIFAARSAQVSADKVAEQASAARSAANDAVQRHVATVSGVPRISAIKDAFNQAKSALRKVLAVVGDVKLLLSDLEPLIYPKAYFADLTSMVDIAFQGLPFGGRNLLYGGSTQAQGSGLDDFKKLRTALEPGAISVSSAAGAGAEILADAAVVQAHARCQAATSLAEAAGVVLAGELQANLLDRADIEAMTNAARSALQVAITDARLAFDAQGRADTAKALALLAYELQETARAVINQRPPLVRRASPVAGPLRLVAHAMYGDSARTAELARLNRLGRAVTVDYNQELLAYVK